MSNRTLTTLDFIISVLREHESELNVLSTKLEESLCQIPTKNLNKIPDILDILNRLEHKASITSTLVTSIKQLVNAITIQNVKLSALIEIMSIYPTNREIEQLRTTITYLTTQVEHVITKTLNQS